MRQSYLAPPARGQSQHALEQLQSHWASLVSEEVGLFSVCLQHEQVRLILVLVILGGVLCAGRWCYAGDKASDIYACQMGGRVGGAGKGVG